MLHENLDRENPPGLEIVPTACWCDMYDAVRITACAHSIAQSLRIRTAEPVGSECVRSFGAPSEAFSNTTNVIR